MSEGKIEMTDVEEISLDLELVAQRLRRDAVRTVGLPAQVRIEADVLEGLAKRLRGDV